MGSDDIMSQNYIKMITEYDNFDVVHIIIKFQKHGKFMILTKNKKLKLSYNHKISEKNGKEYWEILV